MLLYIKYIYIYIYIYIDNYTDTYRYSPVYYEQVCMFCMCVNNYTLYDNVCMYVNRKVNKCVVKHVLMLINLTLILAWLVGAYKRILHRWLS